MEAPKVFISYSHDSPEHAGRVLALSDRLRQDGIDSHIDQYEMSPPEGWPRWMVNKVEWADFVLVVCTETYQQRFKGKAPTGQGKGVKWEGAILIQELYDAEGKNTKVIPVVFGAEGEAYIPAGVLRGQTYYDVSADKGYESLYRRLTNQPEIEKPVLGKLKPMKPRQAMSGRERKNSFGPYVHKTCNRDNHDRQFKEFFFDKCAAPECRCHPHFYIIHGYDGQCHDSLVERFQYRYFADKNILPLRVPWPCSMKLEEGKSFLHYKLCEKMAFEFQAARPRDESQMSEAYKLCKDMSSFTLLKLIGPDLSDLKTYDIVVIVHRIMASEWKDVHKSLLWYLTEYWKPFMDKELPLFLIFLNVVYPYSDSLWTNIRHWYTRKYVHDNLVMFCEAVKQQSQCLLIEELNNVSQEEVSTWIWENAKRVGDMERKMTINEIFKGKTHLPMCEIEKVLEQIALENNKM